MICSIKDCGRTLYRSGLCQTHAKRKARGVPLDTPIGPSTKIPAPPCKECSNPGYALGYCRTHYERFKRGGAMDGVREIQGDKNPNWKGGECIFGGRVYLYRPDHPNKTFGRYVSRARLVMEEYLGRFLSDEEHVHHKNRNTQDDRLENLQVMSASDHGKEHYLEKIGSGKYEEKRLKRVRETCCGKSNLYRRMGVEL